jgi:hypothetical protein
MPTPRRIGPYRLGDAMRRKLEVTSAMAWESLVETHIEQAAQFVGLLSEYWSLDDALLRYLRELDLDETMATAIRTGVLMESDGRAKAGESASGDGGAPTRFGRGAVSDDADDGDDGAGWGLLRQPQRVVRGVMNRSRRNDEIDRIVQLSLARAEERVIGTHVQNAISFVALLEDRFPLDRAVQQYLGAVGLAGGRAQTVFQRTMARLADVHLPRQPA